MLKLTILQLLCGHLALSILLVLRFDVPLLLPTLGLLLDCHGQQYLGITAYRFVQQELVMSQLTAASIFHSVEEVVVGKLWNRASFLILYFIYF